MLQTYILTTRYMAFTSPFSLWCGVVIRVVYYKCVAAKFERKKAINYVFVHWDAQLE